MSRAAQGVVATSVSSIVYQRGKNRRRRADGDSVGAAENYERRYY